MDIRDRGRADDQLDIWPKGQLTEWTFHRQWTEQTISRMNIWPTTFHRMDNRPNEQLADQQE